MQTFLSRHCLIFFEDKSVLEAEITETEVKAVINTLLNCKTPGPDGLSSEYYKLLQTDIVPTLPSTVEILTHQSFMNTEPF